MAAAGTCCNSGPRILCCFANRMQPAYYQAEYIFQTSVKQSETVSTQKQDAQIKKFYNFTVILMIMAIIAALCGCGGSGRYNNSGMVSGLDVTGIVVRCRHWNHPDDPDSEAIGPDNNNGADDPQAAMDDNSQAIIAWPQKDSGDDQRILISEYR